MKIRLDSILILIVSMVLVFFFFSDKSGIYLNGSEAQVYLLIVVTLASLLINLRFKNEFIEILNLVFILFYICRIPFIFSDNVASDVILRNVDVRDIPWHMTVLIFQYLSLVICILVINPRIPHRNINLKSESLFKKILQLSFLILLVNIAYTISFWKWGTDIGINIVAILLEIFQVDHALMLIIISSVMVEKEILAKYKFAVIFSLFLVLGYHLYVGQKSSLLVIMLWVYLAMVTVHGQFIFKLRGLLITAALGFSSFVLYFVGSAIRAYQLNGVPILDHVSLMFDNGVPNLFNSFSYRIGYLDFFIDKVSGAAYKPFVNFTYYFKSLTDKLTPGFDVFDVPFLSRTLYSAYHGKSLEGTNSELITIFAEAHLLLGFFSFFIYLFILFLIKRSILGFKSSSGFVYGLYYMYIVSFFYSWIVGSGLDMLIAIELVYKGLFIFFVIYFITVGIKRRPSIDHNRY